MLRSLSHSDSLHRLQARADYPYLHLYLPPGTPRRRGFRRLCASIAMRARSLRSVTRVIGTGDRSRTTAASSSLRARIAVWVDAPTAAPTSTRHASSSFGPGWYGHATDIHGANGAPREPAGSDDAWARENRRRLGT